MTPGSTSRPSRMPCLHPPAGRASGPPPPTGAQPIVASPFYRTARHTPSTPTVDNSHLRSPPCDTPLPSPRSRTHHPVRKARGTVGPDPNPVLRDTSSPSKSFETGIAGGRAALNDPDRVRFVSPGLNPLPSWTSVRLEPCCAFRREATERPDPTSIGINALKRGPILPGSHPAGDREARPLDSGSSCAGQRARHFDERPDSCRHLPQHPGASLARRGQNNSAAGTALASRSRAPATDHSCSLTGRVGQQQPGTTGRPRGTRGRCRSESGTKLCKASHPYSPWPTPTTSPAPAGPEQDPLLAQRNGRSLARRPLVEPRAEAICTITGIDGSATRYGGGSKSAGQLSNILSIVNLDPGRGPASVEHSTPVPQHSGSLPSPVLHRHPR